MVSYGITTYAHEDKAQQTCYYSKWEYEEILKDFKKQGLKKGQDFNTFTINENEMADLIAYYESMDY